MKQDLLGIGVILTVLGAAGFIYTQEAVPQCTGENVDANKNESARSFSFGNLLLQECPTVYAIQIAGIVSSVGGIAIVIRSLLGRIRPPGFYTTK